MDYLVQDRDPWRAVKMTMELQVLSNCVEFLSS
jgi:hypothetical protein